MIKLCFPNAYIIHTTREPVDTCLSIYFQDFSLSQAYSTDLKSLGLYYMNYRRLMNHWSDLFGDEICDVHYEDLINDTENTLRRAFNYIDLPWDDACLDFYKFKRDVNTPSYQQVRQPLYKSSLNRWKNYKDCIGDLLETLKSE